MYLCICPPYSCYIVLLGILQVTATAVYDHCSSIKEICKLSKGVSGFSRVDLAPITKEEGGSSVWLGHMGCCSSKPGIRTTGNKFPQSFLGSTGISWWNTFHPNKRTPFLYSTLQDVLGPAGTLQRCLIRHRNYLDHTAFQETPWSGSFKYHAVESKEHLPSIWSSFFCCLYPSSSVACVQIHWFSSRALSCLDQETEKQRPAPNGFWTQMPG